MNNILRFGKFTSSTLTPILKPGKRDMTEAELLARPKKGKGSSTTQMDDWSVLSAGGATYVKKKNHERRLGISLFTSSGGKPQSWGQLLEKWVFQEHLPTTYSLNSEETIVHAKYPDFWAGSPDGFCDFIEGNIPTVVDDIKCPYTHESFCDLVQPLYDGLTGNQAIKIIRDSHDSGEEYYQQIVSNVCIAEAKFKTKINTGELIVYMPYLSEISDIGLFAEGDPVHGWIQFATDLPFLPDGGYYKNVNKIRFDIPQEDKDLIENALVKASKYLIPYPEKTTL